LVIDNWGDDDDPFGDRYWVVVKFIKGMSEKDRALLPDDNERKVTYRKGDIHGNNRRPYEWQAFGPSSFFGQEVDLWCELPTQGK
tara:strand:+ start:291 stop:545 length:255 start_codon:yes stop_codon:yes gene_type:complete